jgi:hypothetical protein
MKRIGIEVNGVLRDTIEKFKQIYEKHLIELNETESVDKTYEITFSGETDEVVEMSEETKINLFEYKILNPVTSLNLMDHFSFQNREELYSFMYEEYTMELFGHAPSTEMTSFNILNDLYYELRDNYDLNIISDEIGRSKPATLFFLSKFGCLLEKVFFYSETTKNDMWNSVDILLTANPTLLLEKPKDKIVVKFNTAYNKQVGSDYEINSLSEFKNILEKLLEHVPSIQ